MIVVTNPTGNIGARVVRHLLDAGEALRLIVRDAAKLPREVRACVEVIEGSHGDANVVDRAFRGAGRGVLALPSYAFGDTRCRYGRFRPPGCGCDVPARRSPCCRGDNAWPRHALAGAGRQRDWLDPHGRSVAYDGRCRSRARFAGVHGQCAAASGCHPTG